MGTRHPWIMAGCRFALIGALVVPAACAQLKESMQQQKEGALKYELEQSQFKLFARLAGGGTQAVAEFHRINMLMLAERENAYRAFPGGEEARRCRSFAAGYAPRSDGLLTHNWDDQELVLAFFDRMPASYDQVNNFLGCGVTGSALDFQSIPIPAVEGLLRTHPQLRTAQFRAAMIHYLDELESLLGRVRPDGGEMVLHAIRRARQAVARFIGN